MSSFLSKENVPLGWSMHVASIKALTDVTNRVNEHFIWINEVIAEAKKTLTTDAVELLPKTPSSKKTRRRINSRTSGGGGDNVAPKRTLRSSNRQSSQNSLDFLTSGKLPESKKAPFDLDAIDELGVPVDAVKSAKVRIAEDDSERKSTIENEKPAVCQPSKYLYKQFEEVANKFDEMESTSSARESDISKVIAIKKPLTRESTRKRKKTADAEKDSTISDKENTSRNQTVKDDELIEETQAIGNQYKRPKTSINNTSTGLTTNMYDVKHETESNPLPEDDHVSNDASAEISEAKKNDEDMEHTESIMENNCTISEMPEISHKIPEINEFVTEKNETGKVVSKKDGFVETQKECLTDVIGTLIVNSGNAEDVLVDSVFDDEDQKERMSEDSLECAQEVDLAQTFVQQPISNPMSSSSVQNLRILSPSFPSVVAECKSLLVPVVAKPEQAKPEQAVLELPTVDLSNDIIPGIVPCESRAVEITKTKGLEALSAKSHTILIPEDREQVMAATALIKVTSNHLHLNVNCSETKSPIDYSETAPSNSKSVSGNCSSRNEGLLPFSNECSKHFSSNIPISVSSTESSGDSHEVVFKVSSSSGECSEDSPTVVSSVASSCSYSSGNSSAAVTSSALSSDTLSEDMALCTVLSSSIRDSPKVIPAACSSFMSWEPVSSVTDKVGTITTVASFSPDVPHPELSSDQAETKAAILTELSPTLSNFVKKTPWSASADSFVGVTSTAGVSPSRIYLKVQMKNSSVDVDNSDMPTNHMMRQALDSPLLLGFTGASYNALLESCSSPVCSSPVDNVDSRDHHLMETLTSNVPELGSVKITRNESKLFPTLGSPKSPEHAMDDCKDTSSPLKRFYSKMKVKFGSLLSNQGQTKSSLSSTPRSPSSLSIASSLSRSFRVVSDSSSKQENTAVSSSPDKFCLTPIEDMEVDVAIIHGSSPNAGINAPFFSSPVCLNTTKTKRMSKGRKSHTRRSSVHLRLSTSHRRSSGPQRPRLSKRLLSALKRKMSRTPTVSTPIKENNLVQNDASLRDGGLPFRSTRSKMCLSVAEVACDVAQEEEVCSNTLIHPKDYEDAVSDEDVVCDTPPLAVSKTKVQLEQVVCDGLQQKMNLDTELSVIQGNVGTPASSVADNPFTQTPSTLKQKRPLGSRIKMLQEMICQSPAFSSKSKTQKSNSNTTNNTSSVMSGIKTKKLGLWSTSQRRVSLKRTNKNQKSKAGSQWIDLNNSSSSNTGSVSSATVFTSHGSATKTPVHPASFLNLISKKPSSSSVNSSGSVKSFIPHNTPLKITREEQDEQKRKDLEAKKKKLEEAEQRKQEQRLKKAEELKKQREERQMLAQKRREERQQKDLEQKREMMLKLEETSKASSRAAEERLREEKEKQKLREKRVAEAEQRRKQEEDSRQQMALRMERERELFEDQQRMRRELEDQERQQKVNEQRRQEEERRKQLERERLADQERLRVLEEQKLKEEQEKLRQKEERERREKGERDRIEFERQRERERQKELEIEKQREAEWQRLLLKQTDGEEPTQKEKPIAKLLEKHNQHLKCNSSMISNTVLGIVQSAAKTTTTACTSATRVPDTSASAVRTAPLTSGIYVVPPPVTKPANKGFISAAAATHKGTTLASIVAEHDSDSYDMTPVQKVRKPATEENYDIGDLHSDDSTDDESKPRKKIPAWAQGTHLKALLIAQFTHPPDVEKIFGPVYALDLNDVFKKKKARFNKRTSSAVWDEPLMPKPSSLKF